MDRKRSKGGRFQKKSEAVRREEATESMKAINEKHKTCKEAIKASDECALNAGRRIVDLALLAELLWCELCDKALSLRDIQEERRFGLASIFYVKCTECLDVKHVPTSRTDGGIGGYPMYTVNLRAAMGCLDSGCGHDQFNKCITALNIPPMPAPAFKRSEKRLAGPLQSALDVSLKEAIQEEKKLTEAQLSLSMPDEISDVSKDSEDVEIAVSFDFQWFTRGNGREYKSLTGQGNVIGHKSKKVLAVSARSKTCMKCSRGHSQEDHSCPKNYQGSAKGMEPDTAVQLIVRNSMLKDEGVRVGTLIGDDDSSTISAVRRESPLPIQKWSDTNHTLRGFVSKLYTIMLSGKHPLFTKKVLDYYKKCFQCVLSQNKDNPAGLRESLLTIVPHSFGDHTDCGSWCKAKEDPNHKFKDLPNGQPLRGDLLKNALDKVIKLYADRSESLAPGASSQLNESFNQTCSTKAPKSRHYGGSHALEMRVQTAALQKNVGVTHIVNVANRANMSPSTTAEKYRARMESVRKRRKLLQTCAGIKKRRLFLKQTRKQSNAAATRREGFSYHSDMGISTTLDSAPIQAPVVQAPSNQCIPVIVDIETCGLSPSKDIIQVAAKRGNSVYESHMLPVGSISNEITRLTVFSKVNGELLYHGSCVETIPPRQAAQKFIDFLKDLNSPIVLVGHNIIRFDGPRIIGWLKKHDLLTAFKGIVHGLSDTLKLIGKGEPSKRQEVLARKFLGPEWQTVLDNAHNARVDCEVLNALLSKFDVTDENIIKNSVSLSQLANDSQEKARKKEVKATLLHLKGIVSATMIGKMAAANVTFEALLEQFKKSGPSGVKLFLGQSVGGKVKVTTNSKIVDNVITFLSNYNKENNPS